MIINILSNKTLYCIPEARYHYGASRETDRNAYIIISEVADVFSNNNNS